MRKNRSGIKIWITLMMLLEGTALLRKMELEQRNMQWLLLGYLLLCGFLVFNGHDKNINLKYEFELSMMLKTVLADFVWGVFLSGYCENWGVLWKSLLILAVCNIIGVFIILFLAGKLQREEAGSREDIFILYGKENTKCSQKNTMSVNQELEVLCKQIENADTIYLSDVDAERRNDLLKYCYENDKKVLITAKLSDVLLRAAGISQKGDTPIYYCNRYGIGKMSRCIKRGMDLLFSVLSLLLLWPVFLIIAICIKAEDGGDVIYSQIRCTRDMKPFQIYKFRSMVIDAEKLAGMKLAEENDARLTKVGRFIRNTKLDELPQLINILRGDMSFVGPRPERPELIEKAIAEIPEFVLRTKVKAGLTGYAQVRGNYNTEFLDKLKWDLMYIQNYSLLLDFKIIIMTVFSIFDKNNQEDFSKWE